MTTVDFRTRFAGDAVSLDPTTFLEDVLPPALDAHGAESGRAAARLGLTPLTLDVDGEQLTFAVPDGGRLAVDRGGDGKLLVAVNRESFSDLVQDVASTFGLHMTGRAEVRRGSADASARW